MNKEDIESIIMDILSNTGDGHTDGSREISIFIESLLDNKTEFWLKDYYKELDTENCCYDFKIK